MHHDKEKTAKLGHYGAGAVAALVITGQTLTIVAMVGFIALVGVASRNGIPLLNQYLPLVKDRWILS